MIVKIGNKFTDSKDEPIMIILTPGEKKKLSTMGDQTKFCSYALNELDSADKMREFMKDEEEVKEGYFKNIAPIISPSASNFTRILHGTTALSYNEATALVRFFIDERVLEKAIAIYEKYDFDILLQFRNSLLKT